MPKFLTNIDLTKKELQNAVLQNLSAHPSSPKKGQMYFNTVDKIPYIFTGIVWKDMTMGEEGASLVLNGATITTSTANFYAPETSGTEGDELVSSGSGIPPAWRKQKYSTCSTSGATGAKLVSYTNIKLTVGTIFAVKFIYKNTAESPTLNIGGSGAKGIYYGSQLVSNTNSWASGETVLFVYDGVYWKAIGSDLFGNTKIDKISSPVTGSTPIINSDGSLSSSDVLVTEILTDSDKGVAMGVCPLDADAKVPSIYLPAYIDDVVNLISASVIPSSSAPTSANVDEYYYNTTTSTLYKCILPSTTNPSWQTIDATEGQKFFDDVNKIIYQYSSGEWVSVGKPSANIIYIDTETNDTYRWGGVDLIGILESNIHKYTGIIEGNGNTTAFTITHGLNTRDVIVSVYEDRDLYEQVFCDVYMTSLTAITVVFASAPLTGENYKVTILS